MDRAEVTNSGHKLCICRGCRFRILLNDAQRYAGFQDGAPNWRYCSSKAYHKYCYTPYCSTTTSLARQQHHPTCK